MAGEDEEELVVAEGAVAVGKAEAAVELRVVAKALIDAGHADEDDRKVIAVAPIAQELERSGREAFRLVDDQQLDPAAGVAAGTGDLPDRALMVLDPDAEVHRPAVELPHEVLRPGQDVGRVEHRPGAVRGGVELRVVRAAPTPLVDVGLEGVPVRVAAGGVGLPYAGIAVADPDGLLLADGVRELDEPPVLFGGDECVGHHPSSS